MQVVEFVVGLLTLHGTGHVLHKALDALEIFGLLSRGISLMIELLTGEQCTEAGKGWYY